MSPVADTDLARYMRTADQTSFGDSASLERSRILLRGMSSLAAGLNHMHSFQGWHGDIKPANILVFRDNLLFSDFGTSTNIDAPQMKSFGGDSTKGSIIFTPEYAAPETIEHGRQSRVCDVFSLGCVFLEMYTVSFGRSLSDFERFRTTEHGDKSFHKTLEKTKQWIEMLERYRKCNMCPDQDRPIPVDMILKMLSKNPKNRPTAHEVWLRFPKCACCSDQQSKDHQPPSIQDNETDKPVHTTSTSHAPDRPFPSDHSDSSMARLVPDHATTIVSDLPGSPHEPPLVE